MFGRLYCSRQMDPEFSKEFSFKKSRFFQLFSFSLQQFLSAVFLGICLFHRYLKSVGVRLLIILFKVTLGFVDSDWRPFIHT